MPVVRNTGVPLGQAALDGDGTADRLGGACEFHEEAVAHGLEDTSVMPGYGRFDQGLAMPGECAQRTLVIGLYQPAEADDVRCQYDSEPALYPLIVHTRHSTG